MRPLQGALFLSTADGPSRRFKWHADAVPKPSKPVIVSRCLRPNTPDLSLQYELGGRPQKCNRINRHNVNFKEELAKTQRA